MEANYLSICLRDLIESDVEALTTLEYEHRAFFQPITPLRQEKFYTISEQLNEFRPVSKAATKPKRMQKEFFTVNRIS
ncbi:hypothetical protein [Bacillus xiamenensis]|uniref:hypothetical protein n=1 Tax=Bacillus xiamenensis TaxID=1178537 RepID=UPI000AABF9B9|nr:hypothetical protein [Bacillus xiamenensis]